MEDERVMVILFGATFFESGNKGGKGFLRGVQYVEPTPESLPCVGCSVLYGGKKSIRADYRALTVSHECACRSVSWTTFTRHV